MRQRMAEREGTRPEVGRRRVVIEGVQPGVDGGRFPIKRTVGETVLVSADIFADGHDAIAAVLKYRHASTTQWTEVSLEPLGNDRWQADFSVERAGRYLYAIEAWIDRFVTWQRDLRKRIEANQDVSVDLRIGAQLVLAAAERASTEDAPQLAAWGRALSAEEDVPGLIPMATGDELAQLMAVYPNRQWSVQLGQPLEVVVDREKARFSTWYELFPRSCAPVPGRHGTLADCISRLPYVAQMGFDVLYLPPIHPVGRAFRKGKNNAVSAEPGDVGSPWAIGAREGGHKAILPELGTMADFRRLVAAAEELGIEIALDIAYQCSPDHPYVQQHADWFRQRPDGTIQYAENPPKKYQDIYPFDFETEDWPALWDELKDVILFWVSQGVKIFRVDNPHTKALPFWEWMIGDIKGQHPEVLFLAEAFTRPRVMYNLAKAGFTQSYTYFTWRNSKEELTSYFTELTQTEVREFFRPNLWPNTPDILNEYLQFGGRAAFMARYVLAATLGASCGIYGPPFEHCIGQPAKPGSEEYLDSEKYQVRHWELEKPESLKEFIGRVNQIRRNNAALQSDHSLRFHPVDNDQLICYSKQTDDLSNVMLMVVNLDPHHTQAGMVQLPLESLDIDPQRPYQAHDLLGDGRFLWDGPRNYVELNPHVAPAHIFRIRRRVRSESQFEYFL